MKTKVTKDGFVWLVVDNATAKAIFKKGNIELYRLYNDDSEGAIVDDEFLQETFDKGLSIGIEVGFIKDLCPLCPVCDSKLVPSRNKSYDWECLECDSDFIASEI